MPRQDVLDILTQFRAAKQSEFGIIRIGIFGSTARDSATDRSDVDVVVELLRPDLFSLDRHQTGIGRAIGSPG